MWTFSIMMFVILLITGISVGVTPLFSRQSTPFGVSIPAEHQKNSFIESRKKRFAIINIVLGVGLSLPLFIAPFIENQEQSEMFAGIYVTAAILIQMIASFTLQLKYRKELLVWKEKQPNQELVKPKIAIDTKYHETLSSVSVSTLLWGQLLIIAMTVGTTLLYYKHIPEQIPLNWDVNFEPNHFVEKSYLTALGLPMLQVMMMPVMIFAYYSFIKSRQKLSSKNPRLSKIKSQLFRRAWGRCVLLITLATQLLITFIHFYSIFTLPFAPEWLMVMTFVYLAIVMGATFYVMLKYGQSGERLKLADEDETEAFYTDAEEDTNWKLGMFYYNKEDPAVFVERRFGIGSTFNMARWQSWLAFGFIILFAIATLVWSVFIS